MIKFQPILASILLLNSSSVWANVKSIHCNSSYSHENAFVLLDQTQDGLYSLEFGKSNSQTKTHVLKSVKCDFVYQPSIVSPRYSTEISIVPLFACYTKAGTTAFDSSLKATGGNGGSVHYIITPYTNQLEEKEGIKLPEQFPDYHFAFGEYGCTFELN